MNITLSAMATRRNSDIRTSVIYGKRIAGTPMRWLSFTSRQVRNISFPWLLTTITLIAGTPSTAMECGERRPKRDIVGTWAKVARSNGLRFGVSYHGTPHRVWDEFLPFAIRATPQARSRESLRWRADVGRRQGQVVGGNGSAVDQRQTHKKNTPCPEFVQQFMLRVQDVIDSYNPDILNFDDGARFGFDDGGLALRI